MASISNRVFIELFLKGGPKLKRGLMKVSAAFKRFATQAGVAGIAMGVGARVLGVALQKTLGAVIQLDDAMLSLSAKVQNITPEGFDRLSTLVKKLGRETSFTATEVANLMIELAKVGRSTTEIEQATESMLNLARATGTDTASAVRIASKAMNMFGLSASDTAHVADVLVAATNGSALTMESLGEALTTSGKIAKDAGQSFEGLVAILSQLANAGLTGTRAGTGVKRVVQGFLKKGGDIAKVLDIDVTDSLGQVKDLGQVLGEFGEKTKDFAPLDRIKLFNEAFGLIGLTASLTMAEGSTAMADFNKMLNNLAGTAKKASDKMDSGIGGSMRKLKSATEGVILAIGEGMAPIVEDLAAVLKDVANQLTPVIEGMKSLGPILLSTFAVLAGGAVTLLTLAGGAIVVSAAFSAMSGIVAFLGGVLGAVFATAATVIAFVATPLGIVSALFASLILSTVDWGKLTKAISEKATKMWKNFAETFSGSVAAITEAIKRGELEKAWAIALKTMDVASSDFLDNLLGDWRDTLDAVFKEIALFASDAAKVLNFTTAMVEEILLEVDRAQGPNSPFSKNFIDDVRRTQGLAISKTRTQSDITADFKAAEDARKEKLKGRMVDRKSTEAKKKELERLKAPFNPLPGRPNIGFPDVGSMLKKEHDDAVAALFTKGMETAWKALRGNSTIFDVTRETTGAFGINQLKAKLARKDADISKEQLAEQVTTNDWLEKIKESLDFGTIWGSN